jgi:hypothetical protein
VRSRRLGDSSSSSISAATTVCAIICLGSVLEQASCSRSAGIPVFRGRQQAFVRSNSFGDQQRVLDTGYRFSRDRQTIAMAI